MQSSLVHGEQLGVGKLFDGTGILSNIKEDGNRLDPEKSILLQISRAKVWEKLNIRGKI